MTNIRTGYISKIFKEGYMYITELNNNLDIINNHFFNLTLSENYKGFSHKELDIRKNDKVAFTIDNDKIEQLVIFRNSRFKVFNLICIILLFVLNVSIILSFF